MWLFEDRVEFKDPRLFKTTTQTMRYDQIAQVSVKRGWINADLTIESRGGGTIYFKNVPKGDAERARELINEKLNRPVVSETIREHSGTAPAMDIPDQIRKLAELKDDGILTEQEFEEKKQALLKRL